MDSKVQWSACKMRPASTPAGTEVLQNTQGSGDVVLTGFELVFWGGACSTSTEVGMTEKGRYAEVCVCVGGR